MQKFSIIVTIFLSMLFTNELFAKGREQSFTGKLSSDLKDKPRLNTFSKSGVPISIELNIPDSLVLDAISYKGKVVKVQVKELEKNNFRNFEGILTLIELDQADPFKYKK